MRCSILVLVLSVCSACSAGRRLTSDGGGPSSDGGSVPHDGGSTAHDAGATTHDAGTTGHDAGGATTDAGPPGTAATIEIYSGNGQFTVLGTPGGDQMKVIVLDGAGTPVVGVPVTWTVVSGGMGVNGDTFSTGTTGVSMTDANGIARAGLRGEFFSSMESVVESRISATCSAGSVELHAFSTYTPPGAIPTMPEAYIQLPDSRDFGTQTHGTVLAGGVVAIVVNLNGSEMGHGIEGVGMRFLPPDEPTSDTPPIVSCANATEGLRAGGTVFTDATGHATCDLRVPNTPGDYTIGMFVGGALRFTPFFLHVI